MADSPGIKRTTMPDGTVVIEQKLGETLNNIEPLHDAQDKPHIIAANYNGNPLNPLEYRYPPNIKGALNAPNVIYGSSQPLDYEKSHVHLDSFQPAPLQQRITGGNEDDFIGADMIFGKAPGAAMAEGSKTDLYGNSITQVKKIIDNGDINLVDGLDGNDYIIGGNYTDFIQGGAGADKIYGGKGNDVLHAGNNNLLTGDNAADYIDGGEGNDYILLESEGDVGIGGKGNDIIIAHYGNVTMDGGLDNDTLIGYENANTTVILSPGFDNAYLGGNNDTVKINNIIPEGYETGTVSITSRIKQNGQYAEMGLLFEWKGRDAEGHEKVVGETFVRATENIVAKLASGEEVSINVQAVLNQPVTLTPEGVSPSDLTAAPSDKPEKKIR